MRASRRRRRGIGSIVGLVAACAMASAVGASSGGSDASPGVEAPKAPRPIREIDLRRLPVSLRVGETRVEVRAPSDPEVRDRGGSGGAIFEVVVSPASGQAVVFPLQAIRLAVATTQTGWPTIEAWSAAGGGIYTRAIYAWRPDARRYCASRVDEFEDHGDEVESPVTTRIAVEGRLVRFARSRPFACEPE